MSSLLDAAGKKTPAVFRANRDLQLGSWLARAFSWGIGRDILEGVVGMEEGLIWYSFVLLYKSTDFYYNKHIKLL